MPPDWRSRRPGSLSASSPLRGRPRLRFGFFAAAGFGAGFSRPSIAVESRETWPTSSAPRASFTRASCMRSGRRASENSAKAREKVASLGIAPTRGQPQSLRSVASTMSLSIRSRVVGRSQIALGDEGPRQGLPAPLRPPGAAPARRDEALDLGEVENLDEFPVAFQQRADLLGKRGEKFPLKPGPEIG